MKPFGQPALGAVHHQAPHEPAVLGAAVDGRGLQHATVLLKSYGYRGEFMPPPAVKAQPQQQQLVVEEFEPTDTTDIRCMVSSMRAPPRHPNCHL